MTSSLWQETVPYLTHSLPLSFLLENLCNILAIKVKKVKPFSYGSASSCSNSRPSSLIRSMISI